MAQIKLELSGRLIDGMDVKFKAPCDCTAITGLLVSYIDDNGNAASKPFTFCDAHGNNLAGLGNLFAAGAYVKAILDAVNGRAYLQNADTNKYLEGKLEEPICCGSNGFTLNAADWELNDYGTYEQTKTMSGKGFTPEKHVGFLGFTRGLTHYPGDNYTTWGWSQAVIKSDRKKMACLYSASLIAEDTVKFVASEIPDGALYVTILFFRR